MARIRRSSNGKQKIEIKKIESVDKRQVCFSKRKAGIFLKASELATLCGAKAAILIQSPAGCPFTFGSPSFNHVVRRYLNGGVNVNETKEYEEQRLLTIQELNRKVTEANSKYEEAVGRRKLLVRRIAELCETNEDVSRIENVGHLNIDELRKMIESLDKFKRAIIAKIVNDKAAKSGNHTLANLNLSGFGTGQCSAKSFTTYDNSNNEGTSNVKALDIDLNLFESGSLGHFGELSPIINPDATNVGPSEPPHIPHPKAVSGLDFVELDLLGGRALDIDLNLFESGSLSHFGELSPIINPDATNVRPSEPPHIPHPKAVLVCLSVEGCRCSGSRSRTLKEKDDRD